MNNVILDSTDPDRSFKIKLETYLYITAKRMLELNKGDKNKLYAYMDERIRKIEELCKISRPLRIIENGSSILEVEK